MMRRAVASLAMSMSRVLCDGLGLGLTMLVDCCCLRLVDWRRHLGEVNGEVLNVNRLWALVGWAAFDDGDLVVTLVRVEGLGTVICPVIL